MSAPRGRIPINHPCWYFQVLNIIVSRRARLDGTPPFLSGSLQCVMRSAEDTNEVSWGDFNRHLLERCFSFCGGKRMWQTLKALAERGVLKETLQIHRASDLEQRDIFKFLQRYLILWALGDNLTWNYLFHSLLHALRNSQIAVKCKKEGDE